MPKMTLLKSQKNEIFKIVRAVGLVPFNVKWAEATSRFTDNLKVSRLSYVGSEFFYMFDFRDEKYATTFSPGQNKLVDQRIPGSWPLQRLGVSSWLEFLEREISEPDLWGQISKYQLPEKVEVEAEMGNDPFTVPEAETIASALSEIRSYIQKNVSLSKEHSDVANERMNYLEDALKRQGRRDWVHTCIGVFVTLATTLAFNPEQTKAIWSLLKNALSGLVQLLPG